MSWQSAKLRAHGRPPGPDIGVPPTAGKRLTVPACSVGALAHWLGLHGCLNPRERAVELDRSGVCRFYRVSDDSVVTVAVERAA